MSNRQLSTNRRGEASAEEEASAPSFILAAEHDKKLGRLLSDGQAARNGEIAKGTCIRALIELSSPSVEFLGIVRMVVEKEKTARRRKRQRSMAGAAGAAPKKSPSPLRVVMSGAQRDRINALHGFCVANGLPGGIGTVVRALIESAEPSPEFTQFLVGVHDREREHWYEAQRRGRG